MKNQSTKQEQNYTINPIGYVKKTSEYEGHLEISESFRAALMELKGFSHINVFWWCHLSDNEEMRGIMECNKPYTKSPDSVGIFATRAPVRPNPIAL